MVLPVGPEEQEAVQEKWLGWLTFLTMGNGNGLVSYLY